MILKRLSILNYKNITQAELDFSPKMNCFFGNNGMGKTNLLDAIYYLSFSKSYLTAQDSQVIQHSVDLAVLQGFYDYEGRAEEFFCGIKRGQRKQFKRNKKEYEKLADHIGLLPLVMVSPSDVELVRGGSEERRRFLDILISQHDQQYLHALMTYNRALQQRNMMLKNGSEASLYEVIEDQMDYYAQLIYARRRSFVEDFVPIFKTFYQFICKTDEDVALNYVSKLIDTSLKDLLKENRQRDQILGYTSVGVHKDDLEMTLNEHLIRKIGSQGQTKTYLIALKLAQFDYLSARGNTLPILLLDDIFDKLDATRVEQIIKLVADDRFGQIFITDTNRKYLDEILLSMNHDYKLFRVDKGCVFNLDNSI